MIIRAILFSVLSFPFYYGWAQNEITENLNFERVIENLLPQQEFDLDYNDLYDRLFTLYSNPLDLNKVKRTDLQSLFFLTEEQISGLLEYKESYGKILSYFELLSIEGFEKETVQRLIPFVIIDLNPVESLKTSISHPDNHELFLRYQTTLEQKKGYTTADTTSSGRVTSRYAGDPNRLYARYLYSKSRQYSFGFTVEKDPGERITWDPQTSRYGLDYYSFHGMIENRWIFKKIVIGDFSMDYGQGLIYGSGIRIGKGFEPVTTIRRNNLGIRPYRSVYENKNFSGIAISTMGKSLEFNVFYSYINRDAILREDTIAVQDQFISYIQTIGLHRTPSEINAKHSLSDQSFGGNVNFKTGNRKMEIGLNGIYTKYNFPLLPNSRKYNQFEFSGLTNHLGGLYFNYYLKNAHVFGEMAVSKSKGKAISTGFVASLSSQIQTSIHYRNYDKNFHSFYGKAFGENTKIGNEQGIYWGLRILPISKLVITTYFDFFNFPWLKYQVDAPSQGKDFMISGTYLVNQNLNFRFQYRNKTKEMNYKDEELPYVLIEPKTTERLLLDMDFAINANFSMKTRIQGSHVDFNSKTGTGFILAQDIIYTQQKYSLSTRFAIFDTDNYDNRQFIYERDLLYVYSIPSFYNQGVRYYIVGRYNLSKNVSFWIKFAQTKYYGTEIIGSGLERIIGETKS
ncbi:MAG: helix-hairpin-helix domain-containing protein, partial [Cyclobacteriaceae bacterium]|nr:helix-hairpin-helix domain-containing protein [Cyclobacteriaceae bacterium]